MISSLGSFGCGWISRAIKHIEVDWSKIRIVPVTKQKTKPERSWVHDLWLVGGWEPARSQKHKLDAMNKSKRNKIYAYRPFSKKPVVLRKNSLTTAWPRTQASCNKGFITKYLNYF